MGVAMQNLEKSVLEGSKLNLDLSEFFMDFFTLPSDPEMTLLENFQLVLEALIAQIQIFPGHA